MLELLHTKLFVPPRYGRFSCRDLARHSQSAGAASRDVAGGRLHLTLNTVKAHTRTIYGKLACHSRIQAVTKARAL